MEHQLHHHNGRDLQSVYSRFGLCRTHYGQELTCITFLGNSSRIAAGDSSRIAAGDSSRIAAGDSYRIACGSVSGEPKIFDSTCNDYMLVERFARHEYPLTVVQSNYSSGAQLLLSSSTCDVRLWDTSAVWDLEGPRRPRHSFDGCKTARFSNSGTTFAALSTEPAQEEIMLYDVQTYQLALSWATNLIRGPVYSPVHFSPSDTMLLWNGVLWDPRNAGLIHQFNQLDCGGGGFHPARNEVIINSEVWDLRMFERLRTVDSLDKTVIKFNASGDVIYAILRRDLDENVTSAFLPDRVAHPLFNAFRTVNAIDYSDIATIPVDRCVLDLATEPTDSIVDHCVLDFATEPTDSFVGLVSMDERMNSSATVYRIGEQEEEEDDEDGDDDDEEDDDDEDDSDPDDAEAKRRRRTTTTRMID